jgi:hypothetical protein
MKLFLVILFLFFLGHYSFSQKPQKDSLTVVADTIEGISTDTSIVYIIKKPPVTIREKVEILGSREKKYYYLSISTAGFIYSEKYKANTGYESYTEAVNGLSKPLPSYGFGVRVWKAPKKIITALSINYTRILQRFNYTDTIGNKYRISNNFNYANLGIHVGRWINKERPISFQGNVGLIVDYFISTTGLTINKESTVKTVARLNRVMSYNKFKASINFEFSTLFAIKNSYIEVGPYIVLCPMSVTSKKEAYLLTKNFIGFKVSIINKLF